MKLRVETGSGAYAVHVGEGLFYRLDAILKEEGLSGRVALLADERVLALHGERVRAALPDSLVIPLPEGEAAKTLAQAEGLWTALIRRGFGRQDLAVALGGGAALDLVGFVAATFHRGMGLVHLPTTLLAQVDASVGGKTAIDHPLGKNLIGAFHQPRLVVADLGVLSTLDARDRWAGLAEVAKAALIADVDLLARLEGELEELAEGAPGRLESIVARAIAIKAEVVAEDEHDFGRRQILNFGHTLGHALEAATGFSTLRHGEAVVLGMRAAAVLSHKLGRLQEAEAARALALLSRFPLPRFELPPAKRVLQAMKRDKKGPGVFVTIGPLGQARAEEVEPRLLSEALETLY